jgi:enoyl-CoA hydratase
MAQITFEAEGPIARIFLDNPQQRNAMTPEMGDQLGEIVDQINGDRSLRVAVVRGVGAAFSAGGNLDNLEAETRGEQALGGGANFYRKYLRIRDLKVPSIAAINGHAIGAGFCFTLGCDLRVVHKRAKLGMTFVKLGIHPGMAASWNLPRLIGASRAADLLYTGRLVNGKEAFRLGIANRLADDDDFDSVVDELAGQIAASGPVAVRALKHTLRGTFERSIDDAVEREAAAQKMTFTTADAKEGIQAIQEKRTPKFTGQ